MIEFAPGLVARERPDWGARTTVRPVDQPIGNRNIVLHHDAVQAPTSIEEVQQRILSHQAFHIDERGWADIAYNLILDPFGGWWEGRGLGYQNGANAPINETSVSVALLGNYEIDDLSDGQKKGLDALHAIGPVSWCPGGCSLTTHSTVSATLCPGRNVITYEPGQRTERSISGEDLARAQLLVASLHSLLGDAD